MAAALDGESAWVELKSGSASPIVELRQPRICVSMFGGSATASAAFVFSPEASASVVVLVEREDDAARAIALDCAFRTRVRHRATVRGWRRRQTVAELPRTVRPDRSNEGHNGTVFSDDVENGVRRGRAECCLHLRSTHPVRVPGFAIPTRLDVSTIITYTWLRRTYFVRRVQVRRPVHP